MTPPPPPLRLSVLDQSPVPEGSTGADALRNTIDLARLADELGYHRYWVAEHHGGPMLACASPEALIGPIAAATARLRVGSGGVMLPHYSPLKVAETFSMLAGALPRPHRPGPRPRGGHRPADHLRPAARPPPGRARRLPAAARRAAGLPRRTACPPTIRSPRLAALPGRPELPEPWLLGSSAAERRLGGRSSACPTPSRTSSIPAARRSPRSTASASCRHPDGPRRSRGPGRGRRLGDLRGHRRRGPAAGRQQPHDDDPAAPRAADPGAAAGEGPALPGGRGQPDGAAAAAAARSSARRPGARGDRGAGRASTAPRR